jgi:hypothetical protein
MPRIWLRVVCGFSEIIAIFSPRKVFIKVDFPTLGRPVRETKPERNILLHLDFSFLRFPPFILQQAAKASPGSSSPGALQAMEYGSSFSVLKLNWVSCKINCRI